MLTRRDLERPAPLVAPELLGATISHRGPDGIVTIRLTEVEGYQGQGVDPGSHAFRGQTPRNAVTFGPAGHLYTYFTYGMHTCCNVETMPTGQGSGVLLRAGEVVEGHALARDRRAGAKDRDLARGPARLAVALGASMSDNGSDLLGLHREWWLEGRPNETTSPVVQSGPRVGLSGAGGGLDFPWRFWIDNDPTVSPYRAARARSK